MQIKGQAPEVMAVQAIMVQTEGQIMEATRVGIAMETIECTRACMILSKNLRKKSKKAITSNPH